MTAVVPSAPAAQEPSAAVSMAQIEASGKLPILWLVANGAIWLFIALVLLLIDSLKLHLPSFLAGQPFLTYGRVWDAYSTSLLYGFAVQWAMAGSLWLLCCLGRTRVVAPLVIGLGILVWDLAVTVGVIAILCGQSTGFESIAMPGYLAPILLSAYLLMGICAVLTFHHRRAGVLYPSQWFVVGALFWFPWIFSTASFLLLCWPVRGVLQASIHWWYGHNFSNVFVAFAGLAAIFYFVPRASGRPLSSHSLASLAFWILALFAGWGGVPAGAPLPSWIASVGVVGTVLSSIAVLAIATNFYFTLRGTAGIDAEVFPGAILAPNFYFTLRGDFCAPRHAIAARFVFAGLVFWLLASVQQIAGVLPAVSAVTEFTWFRQARDQLFYYGFFSMTLFGAIYYFTPRLLGGASSAETGPQKSLNPNLNLNLNLNLKPGGESAAETRPGNAQQCALASGSAGVAGGWKPGLMRAHFWLAFFGVLICWLSLLIGGVWQGLLLQDPANTFVSAMIATLPAIRGSTLGILLLLIGVMVFLLNFALLLSRACYRCCARNAAVPPTGKERP